MKKQLNPRNYQSTLKFLNQHGMDNTSYKELRNFELNLKSGIDRIIYHDLMSINPIIPFSEFVFAINERYEKEHFNLIAIDDYNQKYSGDFRKKLQIEDNIISNGVVTIQPKRDLTEKAETVHLYTTDDGKLNAIVRYLMCDAIKTFPYELFFISLMLEYYSTKTSLEVGEITFYFNLFYGTIDQVKEYSKSEPTKVNGYYTSMPFLESIDLTNLGYMLLQNNTQELLNHYINKHYFSNREVESYITDWLVVLVISKTVRHTVMLMNSGVFVDFDELKSKLSKMLNNIGSYYLKYCIKKYIKAIINV